MRVTYYGRELYHADGQRQNHQYIDRIRIGDKFRYFYTQAELAAYNAGRNINNAVTGVNNYFKGKAAIKRNAKLRNPNEKNIVLARQGKTSNKFGRGVVVVRRTIRNGVAPIVKTAKSIGNKVGETSVSVQKAYKDFNTQKKFKKAEKIHAKLRNPNEKNIVLARQGKTSNPLNYKKAVEARGRRDMIRNITSFGNSIPKTTETKEKSIVIKDPPKSSISNQKPKSYKSDIKPVLVEPKKTTKKSSQTEKSIVIKDPPKSSVTNTIPNSTSSVKPILTESANKVQNKNEALKSYTSYYEKLYIKEGADPKDAKRWAKAAAQKRLKEES